MKEFVIESKILNNKATQNPSTLNPLLSKLLAIKIIAALITNRNKPNETTVIGNVKNIKTGLRKIFKRIITNETKMAADIPCTSTPGIKEAIKKMAKAIDITFTKNFIKPILSINPFANVNSKMLDSQIFLTFSEFFGYKSVISSDFHLLS
jgi:hypothetical protein